MAPLGPGPGLAWARLGPGWGRLATLIDLPQASTKRIIYSIHIRGAQGPMGPMGPMRSRHRHTPEPPNNHTGPYAQLRPRNGIQLRAVRAIKGPAPYANPVRGIWRFPGPTSGCPVISVPYAKFGPVREIKGPVRGIGAPYAELRGPPYALMRAVRLLRGSE